MENKYQATATYRFFPQVDPSGGGIIWTLRNWLKTNERVNMMLFAHQIGGWEGWVQVEAAQALSKSHGPDNVRREEHIYQNDLDRVDLWLSGQLGIELKCRTPSDGDSRMTEDCFPARMSEDIIKVNNRLSAEHKNKKMMCVGFTLDPTDLICRELYTGTNLSSPCHWIEGVRMQWFYLHRGNNLTVEQDFERVKYMDNPEFQNIYCIWYEK